MRSVIPGGRDVGKLGDGGENHDESRYTTTKSDSRPSHLSRRAVLKTRGIDLWRVEGGVKVIERNVDDPDAVEVDQKVGGGAFFIVCLEKDLVPVNLAKFHEPLGGRNVD
jgi:hypothetical protein